MTRRSRPFAALSAMFGLHHGRHRAYAPWFDRSAESRHKVLSMRCPSRHQTGPAQAGAPEPIALASHGPAAAPRDGTAWARLQALSRGWAPKLGLIVLLISALLLASHAAAGDRIEIEGPYVRAVPPGQPNSAAFLRLTNEDAEDHALVAAESDVAMVVELHTHTKTGGLLRMRKVDRIPLPAGETVRLAPGGLHLMLIGLKRQLAPGDMVDLTLIFEDGGRRTLTAPVEQTLPTARRN